MFSCASFLCKTSKLTFGNVLPSVERQIIVNSCNELKWSPFIVWRPYSMTSTCYGKRGRSDRKSILSTVAAMDEGADGEKSVDIDKSVLMTSTMFPNKDTPKLLFDGVTFDSLHICHINVHKNNTKLAMTNCKGTVLYAWTCGAEGFKNAKKGTNIAAQATAITFSMKAQLHGIQNIRVKIGGLGPGRMAALKGLQMGGMNIVSISDTTSAPEHVQRPRKQRRL